MNDKERTAWSRKNGIFIHHLDQWEKDAISAVIPKTNKAQLLGLTIRTLQRWGQNGLSDNRKGSRAAPGNVP